MAKNNFNEEDGVWRTVGGRRIFIRKGQNLTDAMKESGKFKTGNRREVQQAIAEQKIDKLGKKNTELYKEYGAFADTGNKEENKVVDKAHKKWLKNAKEANELKDIYNDYSPLGWEKDTYNNPKEYKGDNSDLEGKHIAKNEESPSKNISANDATNELMNADVGDWNNMNQAQRDKQCEKILNDFEDKYGDKLKDDEFRKEVLEQLEDQNFHTMGKVIDSKYNEKYGTLKLEETAKNDKDLQALEEKYGEKETSSNKYDNLEQYEVYEQADKLARETKDYDLKSEINKRLDRIDRANSRGTGYANKPTNELREILKNAQEKDRDELAELSGGAISTLKTSVPKEKQERLKPGTEIYYEGDQANLPGYFTVESFDPTKEQYLASVTLKEKEGGHGRTIKIGSQSIDDDYGQGSRFSFKEDYDNYRNKIFEGYKKAAEESKAKKEKSNIWEKQEDGSYKANKEAMKTDYEERHKRYDEKIKQLAEDRENMTNSDWEASIMAYEKQNADGTFRSFGDIYQDVEEYEKKKSGRTNNEYTKEELKEKFGTDNVDLINAGRESNRRVSLKEENKTSEIKVKGDKNIIPRDFEKGYGRFKVETNSNKGHLDDRYEITKDEYGDYHAKNLRTGETYTTFRDHLGNNNVFEFENGAENKSTDWVRNAFNKYKKEHPGTKKTFAAFKKENEDKE